MIGLLGRIDTLISTSICVSSSSKSSIMKPSNLCLKHSIAEVEAYCRRDLDIELEIMAQKIAIIKLNRLNTEGLSSQSFSGVNENYIDGYPQEILSVLNRKRKIKVV
jgi:hypothetical protein